MSAPIDTALTRMLGIDYPIIMAPMFLVSNARMVIEAARAGITGAIPALNYRTDAEFRKALAEIKDATDKPFGINLITNKSNIRLREQLNTCKEYRVPFIITSLGSPQQVIEECKPLGMKVFCDVIDLEYAKKVEAMQPDALIAVNNQAGGHAGHLSPQELISTLVTHCRLPVISAGGVGHGSQMKTMLDYGACGISVGSPFIASVESPVSHEYKMACVNYGAKDIVMTTKLSGTPCTVINTDYVKKIGTEQNWLERILNRNKRLKKWAKMLTFYKGMKMLERAAFSATYQTLWCAGPSIEYVKSIRPVREIAETLVREYYESISAEITI
ncbi:MAG: nitronate monooxygenase [Chitinophagales bacterium]|nr:nitronate monooxygenase [Chitinophagales bacterium]MDW8419409.1 nitronate monooxygenase [Chitinophagales bacterium]